MDESNYTNSLKLVESRKDEIKIDLSLMYQIQENLNVPDPYFWRQRV